MRREGDYPSPALVDVAVSSVAQNPGHQCRPSINELLNILPPKTSRQTLLFSATFPRNIEELCRFALRPGYSMIDTIGEDAEQTADKVRL